MSETNLPWRPPVIHGLGGETTGPEVRLTLIEHAMPELVKLRNETRTIELQRDLSELVDARLPRAILTEGEVIWRTKSGAWIVSWLNRYAGAIADLGAVGCIAGPYVEGRFKWFGEVGQYWVLSAKGVYYRGGPIKPLIPWIERSVRGVADEIVGKLRSASEALYNDVVTAAIDDLYNKLAAELTGDAGIERLRRAIFDPVKADEEVSDVRGPDPDPVVVKPDDTLPGTHC